MKAHELRDWEEEDHQVEEDVEGAVDVDCRLGLETGAFVLAVPLVPEEADGPAFGGVVDDEAC